MSGPTSPYDDPAVSAGEIADYLHLQPEPMGKTSKTKVGRYPLQKVGSETMPDSYESADYLYEFETGYVWLRTVHDLSTRTHALQMVFIHQGIKFQSWLPPLVVPYDERMLCRAARDFAKEHIKP